MLADSLHQLPSGENDIRRLLELSTEEWLLRRKGFKSSPRVIQVNETLLTLGNGYLNIRGSLEELPPGHSGGMYLAGIYDKSESDVLSAAMSMSATPSP